MKYDFLVETYETERIKVVSTWAMFRDEHLEVRPLPVDTRGRSFREQMVHQCVSEDLWFRTMLGIDVGAPPLPTVETRLEFMKQYSADSEKRLRVLREKDEPWWETDAAFFDVQRPRTWIMVRRLCYTSQHRGQLLVMLRSLVRAVYSNYGPTADTGGLMQNHAPTIYAYSSVEAILEGEVAGGNKTPIPGVGDKPVTERPTAKGI